MKFELFIKSIAEPDFCVVNFCIIVPVYFRQKAKQLLKLNSDFPWIEIENPVILRKKM